MQGYVRLAGMLMLAAPTSSWAVADAASVSIQDLNPACKERHANIPPEQCVIQNRLSPSEHARRYGGAVILIDPRLSASTPLQPSAPETAGVARERAR
jgi:hypothetical protein